MRLRTIALFFLLVAPAAASDEFTVYELLAPEGH